MMYLIFKELASSASDVIMMTQSIMKDTGVGSDVLYKANAIRALVRIIDVCRMNKLVLKLLNRNRQPPCKQLNGLSRPPLLIETPPSHLLRWSHHTTSSL